MEREKKRTKEEEEELDRKIAQIREKNQKIVERTREVEEDKAKYAVDEQKGASKPIVESPTTSPKKGEWSREWDQGKTSADTWRENVPSIELSSRLAGRGGSRGKSGGGGRGNSHNNKPRNQPDIQKGSRLEGRLTIPSEGKEKGDNSGNRNVGRGGNRARPTNTDSREVTKKGKDLKVKITNDKISSQANQQQAPSHQKQHKRDNNQKVDNRKEKPAGERFNKDRRSQNDDRHVIKLIIKKAIDKIEYLERCEKRRLKQEADNSIEVFETSKEDYRSEEEHSEKSLEDAEQQIVKEIENVPEDLTVCEESKQEEIENDESKNEAQDANQNVIKLVAEKVLTLEVSS
ncbi:unnamed protein product [Auanema sp. JU1783]|nr:unnamed protein product [Auanema sp. JU1783]